MRVISLRRNNLGSRLLTFADTHGCSNPQVYFELLLSSTLSFGTALKEKFNEKDIQKNLCSYKTS
jgi:hypothetical protein